MDTYEGRCRYCGSAMSVIAEGQDEADQMATEECTCKGAEKESVRDCMQRNLMELIGSGCEEAGFEPISDAAQKIIADIADAVCDGIIQRATIRVEGTDVKIVDGEKIKLSRKYTHEEKKEA